MRYEHWLRAARPSPWPGAVLCVSCTVSWERDPNHPSREYATLDSWHVQLCTRYGDGYAVSRTASGTTAESFWATVKTATLRGRNVWVISTEFRAVAAVLGLWDRLETGHVRIAGTDSRTPRGQRGMPTVPVPHARGDRIPPPQMGVFPGARSLPVDLAKAGGGQADQGRRGPHKRAGVCILEDPPIVLELTGDSWGGKITWVDAANYGVEALRNLAAAEPAAQGTAQWFCAAASTLHSLGPCGWQSTAASQAMHLYRAVYHATPTLCHTQRDATALERAGLFGGRCEPFRLGRVAGNCRLYDFRSMYPYLYSTTSVPVRLVDAQSHATAADIIAAPESEWWIAEVDIETDEPEYPYRAGSTVIYPVGRFTTVLCGPELRRGIDRSRITKVRRAARYEADGALGGYADALYRCRQQADRDSDQLLAASIKRLMNCLHGKFAQQDRHWEECPNAECPWEWAEWYHRLSTGEFERRRVIGGAISREEKGGFAHGTVPAIAVAIASAGRTRLLDAMLCAGWEHVHYVDTDALIVDDYGAESLTIQGWVRPGEWGYLQHVISADGCDIGGVKRYTIGGRTVEAGHGRMGSEMVDGGSATRRIPGVRERMSRQLPPADWREAHPWQPGPGRYEARRQPGGRVLPAELDEWRDA